MSSQNLNYAQKKSIIHQFLQSPCVRPEILANRIASTVNSNQSTILKYLKEVTEAKPFGRVLKKDVLSDLEKESKQQANRIEEHKNSHKKRKVPESPSEENRAKIAAAKRVNNLDKFIKKQNREYSNQVADLDIQEISGTSSHSSRFSSNRNTNQMNSPNFYGQGDVSFIKPKPIRKTSEPTDFQSMSSHVDDVRMISNNLDQERKIISRSERIDSILSTAQKFSIKNVPEKLLSDYLTVYDFCCKFRKIFGIDKEVMKLTQKKDGKSENESNTFPAKDLTAENFTGQIDSGNTPMIQFYTDPEHISKTHLSLKNFAHFLHDDFFVLFTSLFSLLQAERKKEKVNVFFESVRAGLFWLWENLEINESNSNEDENSPNKDTKEENVDEKIEEKQQSKDETPAQKISHPEWQTFGKKNDKILAAHGRLNWFTSKPSFSALVSFFIDLKRMQHLSVPSEIDLSIIQQSLKESEKKRKKNESSHDDARKNQIIESSETEEKPPNSQDAKNEPEKPQKTIQISLSTVNEAQNISTVSKIRLLKFLIDILYETTIVQQHVREWNLDLENDNNRLRDYIKDLRNEIRRVKQEKVTLHQKKEIGEIANENDQKTEEKSQIIEFFHEKPPAKPKLDPKKIYLPPFTQVKNLDLLLSNALDVHNQLLNLLKRTSLSAEIMNSETHVFILIDNKVLFYEFDLEKLDEKGYKKEFKVLDTEDMNKLISFGGIYGEGLKNSILQC